ncbi:NUDIX hydrolase [Palleronia caenipelagi]|uniref:NUDIX hydrolase n=1 Tax=Palleronia caenipelagi TaxID=2489174 RepID=A0A547QAD1_9RHOB|nr:NUDIX hydrolase [Palleronia caenipelagi]TRD23324.1 NUDIX hydrolase [Palleronia caenipelagi]
MGQNQKPGQKIILEDLGKRSMRAQLGSLCWRRAGDEIEVCLITTRDTGRWMIPKGWPMHGKTPAQCAATEAWEEAGLRGAMSEMAIGVFHYVKDLPQGDVPVMCAVYPMEVTKEASKWDERNERKRRWVSLEKAARKVDEPELSRLLRDPTLPDRLR